jgi:hypothetical protein
MMPMMFFIKDTQTGIVQLLPNSNGVFGDGTSSGGITPRWEICYFRLFEFRTFGVF